MSEVTICQAAACMRPSDGWILCRDCGRVLTEVLTDMGWMLDELDLVLTGQVRYVSQSTSKSSDTPMPFDVKASETRAYLTAEIATAVRLLEEANRWESQAKTEKAAALWLRDKVSAIRLHPAGGDIIDNLLRWWAAGQWVIDRPTQRQYLGDCEKDVAGMDCGGRIYGRQGKAEARCDTCGGEYEAEEMREKLLNELDERLCTASEIAHLSTYLGLVADRTAVRKRINQWHTRKRVSPHPNDDGDVRFRFGEVYVMLLQDDALRQSA
jgi:hypothetical protein